MTKSPSQKYRDPIITFWSSRTAFTYAITTYNCTSNHSVTYTVTPYPLGAGDAGGAGQADGRATHRALRALHP
eukprot:1434532-Pyramimonas_sp.AAC.1